MHQEFNKVATYEQLDKKLIKIRKKKRQVKRNSFKQLIKNQFRFFKFGKLYDVNREFVNEVITLIDTFYTETDISFEEMLIRKDKIINYNDFRTIVKIPITIVILTSALFILTDVFQRTKEVFDFLGKSSLEVVRLLISNSNKVTNENVISICLSLLCFLLIIFITPLLILLCLKLYEIALIMFMSLPFVFNDKVLFIEKYEIEILNKKLGEGLNERISIHREPVELIFKDPIKVIAEQKNKTPKLNLCFNSIKAWLFNILNKNT